MDFEDIISIIFLVIFFLGPLIKKIVQGLSGEASPTARQKRTVQEVTEYLEKMRAGTDASNKYRAPSHRPYAAAKSSTPKQSRTTKVAQVIKSNVDAESSIDESKVHAAYNLAKKDARNVLKEIMVDPRFNDMQKAIIFSEIMRAPNLQ